MKTSMVVLFAFGLCMCNTIRVDRTECPRLAQYATRERIPMDVLDQQGTEWPQYVRDYSVSHGPKLTREEMREFTQWQVK